ncbi:ABC transporter ATP-binding protein [Skermanella aerolata]|uniref:ABC transporter ATP-binding protein n=1 Tax=Skermanella aerolata TaxID=393310 RepID=A0A512DQA1_9PROT|nr:ABC transporter ATP-binding protein [Skermanella aerolata]GEO38629.1 ABC transporter ATP-binding protein [Skermanella aerolata]
MTAPLLILDSLSVGYGGAPVVDAVSLRVAPGEVLALLGANGAGKSSLMRAVIGLEPAASGRIVLDGADITALPPERRARMGLGYVPEGRRVFPGMSVRDNLEVASFAAKAVRTGLIERVFALFPQLAPKSGDSAWRLSGGQQQMLAIGRALMGEPRLLLLDEPSMGLSPRLTSEVMATVRAIAAGGTAVLLAEQAARRALQAADRGLWLHLGRVADTGDATVLLDRMGDDPDFPGTPLATGPCDGAV